MKALGIDVGAGKGMDLVLLDRDLVPLRVVSRVPIERVGALLEELRPDVVAIDAPPAWASSGKSRMTERILAERNIHAFNTPSAAHGQGQPFYRWMEVGFEVFRVAEAHGFPRYRSGEPRGTAMEVFPHASATVLAGALPPKGTTKRAWRASVLGAHGVVVDELRSADRVDAALCALTGLLALQGKRSAPGDPKEGVIVLPVSALPARPYRHAPAEVPAAATVPLFRECACGDPACHELARVEFAPGHDSKRKSMLWRATRSGNEAIEELRRRGWALPPEAR